MEESTVQVMKLLCYEFADIQPAVLQVRPRGASWVITVADSPSHILANPKPICDMV